MSPPWTRPGAKSRWRHDLLRPGIPGERQNFDAEGRGADFGSQRLPHGDQPPFQLRARAFEICWPSRPAIIRIRSRIATAAPAYSTGWRIFRSRTAPGIPASCKPAARRGFIWRGWICSSCAGIARRRSTAMHTGVRNGTACWWTPRGGSPSSGRITGVRAGERPVALCRAGEDMA